MSFAFEAPSNRRLNAAIGEIGVTVMPAKEYRGKWCFPRYVPALELSFYFSIRMGVTRVTGMNCRASDFVGAIGKTIGVAEKSHGAACLQLYRETHVAEFNGLIGR